MNVVQSLNFKHGNGSGLAGVIFTWLFCTALNAITVFVLISAGLLAWRHFG